MFLQVLVLARTCVVLFQLNFLCDVLVHSVRVRNGFPRYRGWNSVDTLQR